jgi:hypothetical protein
MLRGSKSSKSPLSKKSCAEMLELMSSSVKVCKISSDLKIMMERVGKASQMTNSGA